MRRFLVFAYVSLTAASLALERAIGRFIDALLAIVPSPTLAIDNAPAMPRLIDGCPQTVSFRHRLRHEANTHRVGAHRGI